MAIILSYACVYVLYGGGFDRNTDFNLSTNDINPTPIIAK